MKPQTSRVLSELRWRGARGLSPNEARLLIGTDRLAARVAELREAGHVVTTTREHNLGDGTHARYRLVEEPVQLSVFDSPVSAREVPPLGARAHQAAERQPQRAVR